MSALTDTYTGEKINIMQEKHFSAMQYVNDEHSLDLLVVEKDSLSLKGQYWLSILKPNLSVFYSGTQGATGLWRNCLFIMQISSKKNWRVSERG